ncbi:hypothetical protein [Streptomyces sp. CB03911]|uniref:hypothetical protein n=1 Tax=Streptomyces sp. CB03911 TaxID=1804758 RepID=UPI00093D8E77|nr:hypothetical protein [Streptomyces sp. CB03911]OKI19924.1 hypothetical protein A6A07_38085 [Streptomyces sp. CB03911]
MLPIDPQADIGRRAWAPCPTCRTHETCDACREGRNCADHWRYLLSNTGSLLHLQCPGCTDVWDHETGFGATRSGLGRLLRRALWHG